MLRELFVCFLAGALVFSCTESKKSQTDEKNTDVRTYFCDAETADDGHFSGVNASFGHGETQTDLFAFEGEYSSAVGGENPYGFELVMNDLEVGNFIIVEVYQKGGRYDNPIVISNETGSIYERTCSDFEQIGEWRKVVMEYTVKEPVKWLKTYIMSEDSAMSYYDNFKVSIFPHRPAGGQGLPKMEINFKPDDFDELSDLAEEARKLSILTNKTKKNFKIQIRFKGETQKGKAKLKGDWADHVKYRKWSFRVNIKGDNTIDGQEIFSLHNPNARWFLEEWAAHEIMREENIISPRYQFVQLYVNGENWGVYAMEEHFTKLLIENMEYREGPIMKFDESGIWERREVLLKNNLVHLNLPILKSAEIDMFRTGKVLNDSTKYRQFLEAKNLMYAYQQGDNNMDDVLNLKLWARQYALSALLGMKHSILWTNQRMYYNPVTNYLEPIGYDCFTINNPKHELFWLGIHKGTAYGNIFTTLLFRDRTFLAYFEDEINRLSDSVNLVKYEALINSKWDDVKPGFVTEFPYYTPDFSYIHGRADSIRFLLNEYKKNFELMKPVSKDPEFDCSDPYFLENVGLQVFQERIDGDKKRITLRNHHPCGLHLLGYAFNKGDEYEKFSESNNIQLFDADVQMTIPADADRIVYAPLNNPDNVKRKKIHEWPIPTRQSALQKYIKTSSDIHSVFRVDDRSKTIQIGPGKINLSNHVFIPAGYRVNLIPGTTVNLTNSASIVSKSPVFASGPMVSTITSSDGTGQGLHVLQVSDTSSMKFVTVENITTLNFGYWQLTGAVTFYESPVRLDNFNLNNIKCEDGLNIIRSWLDLKGCSVTGCFSDGVDIDFGTGEIRNCSFTKNGNDGLDMSGSVIWIGKSSFKDNGDKGISFGEGSQGEIENSTISGNVFGIASKDRSKVIIRLCEFVGNTTALTAFQKKPEFGPSNMEVQSSEFKDNGKMYEVDKNSRIKREGKVVAFR